MIPQKQIDKVLKRIQDSVPKEWRDKVVREIEVAPETVKVLKKAIEADWISAEKRQRFKDILPDFDKRKVIVDETIAKKINDWVENKIQKAIKRGELPPREELKNYENINPKTNA